MSVRNDLIGDRRGSAAVEFAFIVPIVLALYFGMVEATQALLANRRASAVTTAVGDLVTQQAQVTSADVNGIFGASTAIMKPFSTDTNFRVGNVSKTPSATRLITFAWAAWAGPTCSSK